MELTLVGTGHVFDIGAAVEGIVATRRPDVVCVELDPVRLRGLEERRRLAQMQADGDPRAEEILAQQAAAVKKLPFVYRMLAKTQERLAEGEGVEAGGEMLAAVDAARSHRIPLACIDVDAQRLIRRAWGEMGLLERLRFLWVLVRGGGQDTMEGEMAEYQSDPVAYLAKVGDQFPTLKRVLIDERDAHMARAILELAAQPERIPGAPETVRVVAVVGDGHVTGMLAHLKQGVAGAPGIPDDDIELVRVGDLRDGHVPSSPFPEREAPPVATMDEDTNRASWSVEVDAVEAPAETDDGDDADDADHVGPRASRDDSSSA